MSGPEILLSCDGGAIVLPASDLVLVDREDGGNLIVDPPRPVWERSALGRDELAAWSFLVAAAGEAMLASLKQLEGGCINYWEAGNWALNHDADPPGPKTAPRFRRVHTHLLGRSRMAASPDWAWGEVPRFPAFAGRHAWAANNRRLTDAECDAVIGAARGLLSRKYGMAA
jgi:hypothetical protein